MNRYRISGWLEGYYDDKAVKVYFRVDDTYDSNKKVRYFDTLEEAYEMCEELESYDIDLVIEDTNGEKYEYYELKYDKSNKKSIDYIDKNFEYLVKYPISFSKINNKYYMVGLTKIEIPYDTMIILIDDVKE